MSSSSLRILKCARLPRLHAKWRAVRPMLSFALTSGPSPSIVCVISGDPILQATIRVVAFGGYIGVSICSPELNIVTMGTDLSYSMALKITSFALSTESYYDSTIYFT